MSQGVWSVVTVGAGVLLVLTVNTCRHPRAYRAALGSDCGYGGGALVGMRTRADREREGRRQRDGQAKMYFRPVELQDQSIVVALPQVAAPGLSAGPYNLDFRSYAAAASQAARTARICPGVG